MWIVQQEVTLREIEELSKHVLSTLKKGALCTAERASIVVIDIVHVSPEK